MVACALSHPNLDINIKVLIFFDEGLRGVTLFSFKNFSISFLELYLFAGGSKLRTFYHPPIRLTFSVRRKSGPRWLAMGKEAARIIDKRKGIKSDPVVPWAPH